MPARILLVRHGESEWNALGRWQGQADPPLSDLGRRQAAVAANHLAGVDVVFASTLRRAAETASIIAAALGVPDVTLDADLMERDAGEWSGLTRAEIEERYPGYLEPPPADKHTSFGPAPAATTPRRPPGWEDDDHLLARALRAVGRLATTADGRSVLAVTHGGLIYTIERHLDAPFERLANLAGRWLTVNGEGISLGERIRLIDPEEAPVTVPDQL
jgi:probable phosphoglycerate mutase